MNYNFALINAVELRPSDIKLSTLLEDNSRVAEFVIRAYFDMGMKGYSKMTDIIQNADSIEDFCERFYQTFMKPMANFPGFFDVSVENDVVRAMDNLTDSERQSVWKLFAQKIGSYPWTARERYDVMMPGAFVPEIDLYDVMRQYPKLENLTVLPAMQAYIKVPIFICNIFIDYLYAKWYGSKHLFEEDSLNIAYTYFIKGLCEECFQHNENSPERYFIYALPMKYPDVMEKIVENFTPKNGNINTFKDFMNFYGKTLQQITFNAKRMQDGDELTYLFAIRDILYSCNLKRNDHVHNGRYRVAFTFTMTNDETGKDEPPVIFYDKITESDVYNFFGSFFGEYVFEDETNSNDTTPREVTLRDLDEFLGRLNTEWGITTKQAEANGTVFTRWYNYEWGKRWIRITTGSYTQNGKGSAYCFIDSETGDIHKANGYKNVDKHIRGNIFGENPLNGLNEYGTIYLR